jgi:hypothetical protein
MILVSPTVMASDIGLAILTGEMREDARFHRLFPRLLTHVFAGGVGEIAVSFPWV